jgi:hypothetical protein
MRPTSSICAFFVSGMIAGLLGCGQGSGSLSRESAITTNTAGGITGNSGPGAGQGSQAATYVFTANVNDQSLSSFALDANGKISSLGPPKSIQGSGVWLSSVGNYLATLAYPDKTSGTLSLYTVDRSGFPSLKASANVPQAFAGQVIGDSRFAYVAASHGVFAFDTQDGGLQPLAGNPFDVAGGCPAQGLATGGCGRMVLGMAITPERLLYSEWNTHDSGSIKVFSRSADGSLTGDSSPGRGASLAVTPDGRFLYLIESFHYDVLVCFPLITPSGSTPFPTCTITGGSRSNYQGNYGHVLASRDGHFLFATNRDLPRDSAIYSFRIDPNSGALTEVPGSPFLTSVAGAGAMTMDATGRFLLVAHGDTSITNYSNDVVVLALDPSTGSLRKVSSAKAGDGPASIAALAISE